VRNSAATTLVSALSAAFEVEIGWRPGAHRNERPSAARNVDDSSPSMALHQRHKRLDHPPNAEDIGLERLADDPFDVCLGSGLPSVGPPAPRARSDSIWPRGDIAGYALGRIPRIRSALTMGGTEAVSPLRRIVAA
jgi:hypothetical protein